jgi:hypothetical protein
MPAREERGSEEPPRPRLPSWVKALALIGLAVAIVVVAVLLFAGGDHGPGRHT